MGVRAGHGPGRWNQQYCRRHSTTERRQNDNRTTAWSLTRSTQPCALFSSVSGSQPRSESAKGYGRHRTAFAARAVQGGGGGIAAVVGARQIAVIVLGVAARTLWRTQGRASDQSSLCHTAVAGSAPAPRQGSWVMMQCVDRFGCNVARRQSPITETKLGARVDELTGRRRRRRAWARGHGHGRRRRRWRRHGRRRRRRLRRGGLRRWRLWRRRRWGWWRQ